MTRKCTRCGDQFPARQVTQVHCTRCGIEVAAIVLSDEKRRTRFPFAKPLDYGRTA